MVKIGLWAEKNVFLIHIRDYKIGPDGRKHISEKKGIALTLKIWQNFLRNIADINEDV
jgi:hypothetical protein